MTQEALALFTLASTIAGLAVVWFFRSPKELISDLNIRIKTVEDDHDSLARRFERHDEAMKNLTKAVDSLTVELRTARDLFGKQNNNARPRR